MYCSVQQARDAGTTGTDAEVTAWITAAMERITSYTQQTFEPTPLVVVADVAPDGLVILPRRVRQVTSVTPVGGPSEAPSLPVGAYTVTSADVLGSIDAVRLAWGGYDDLVVGAESWAGGWRGLLLDRWHTEQVSVAGTFGYAEVPPLVAQATALLAAHLQGAAAPTDPDAPDAGLDVDDEGNNVRIEPDAPSSPVAASSSTGSTQVDSLLVGYLNHGVSLIGGV